MILVGVTGGIGMGKSAAATLLEATGIPVVDTDDIARRLVEPGSASVAEIGEAFGPEVIAQDGSLARQNLARLVFNDATARGRLEQILHPRIAAVWRAEVARWKEQGQRFGAVVIPLLFEKAYEAEFEAVVCIACSAGSQERRLRERGWSADEISTRKAAQLPVGEKITRSRFVVWTEGSVHAHGRQWDRILRSF
jgi:dephospho-CoA kinase